MSEDVHGGLPVLTAGASPATAEAAMVLVHGRGATAADILYTIAPLVERPGWAFLAPEAAGDTWYPHPFTAPLEANEPWLSSALGVVAGLVSRFPAERTILLGFSQGACLALEYAARNPRRYGAVVGLSGGLIGPQIAEHRGSLAGTPVFLGCSDVDPHIPAQRVRESAAAFRDLGAEVELRLYPGMGHEVNQDELGFVRGLMAALPRRPNVEEVSR